MITTGSMPVNGRPAFRLFEHEGVTLLARVSYDDDGPGLFVEGYDTHGRYRCSDPARLEMESGETGVDYLLGVLEKLTDERAYKVFLGESDADEE